MQKRHLISAALAALILLLGALFWSFQRGVILWQNGSVRFALSAITNPVPSLDRTTVFPDSFNDEAKNLFNTRVADAHARIEKNPYGAEAWLDLAIYYRMVGDNAGAVEIWEYVVSQSPQESVSLHNLGQHYFHEEKDYAKAEKYYELSIAASPRMQSNYSDLYEMYRYVYKQDTAAAVDILLRAMAQVGSPGDIQFTMMLGRHYRDVVGDKENARQYLTQARDAAQARGDRSIATELTKEISAL
jgi:tetratricopeptide (TPR) repeat protein